MAEGTGAAGAMGGVAAAVGTTGGDAGTGTGQAQGGAPKLSAVQGGAGGGGQPTQGALDSATPSKGQSPGEAKTWDVKVDGRVVKMTESEMMQAASLGKAAFKRMEEANGLKSRVDAFWEEFQADPMAALDKLPQKLSREQKREMIEKYYKKEFIDQDALTPQERALAEREKRVADKEKEQQDKDEKAAAEGKAKLQGQWRDHYSKVIMEALDKGGLPKTPKTVGRMAFYLAENARNKIDQTMEQVVKRVEQDYAEEFQGLTSEDAPVEALLRILGPNAVKKLQRYAIEEHKKRLAAGVAPQEPAAPRGEPKKKEDESRRDGWKKTTSYWTRHDK